VWISAKFELTIFNFLAHNSRTPPRKFTVQITKSVKTDTSSISAQ